MLILLNKFIKKIRFIFFRKDIHIIFLAFILSGIIRLIRPIIKVRIIQWGLCTRIGHFASEGDIYLSEKKWGVNYNEDKQLCLYYVPRQYGGTEIYPANKYLYKLAKRKIPGLRYSKLLSWVDVFNCKFFKEIPLSSFREKPYFDKSLVTIRTPPPYKMTKRDIEKAKTKMLEIGIDEKKPILLFFNRDSAYINSRFSNIDDQVNSFRNSNIQNYMFMAHNFVSYGYTCLRMGEKTETKIRTKDNLIDISSYPKDELLEFYLFLISKFSISDSTGLNMLSLLFRKPKVVVNVAPLLAFYDQGDFQPMFDSLIIFKKHWCITEKRLLTASEIIERKLLNVLYSSEYINANIKLIDNTPEEIQEVALEMHQRLNGEWVETEEDILLQHRFWKHLNVKRDLRFLSSYPRVGANFLRDNEWLLV